MVLVLGNSNMLWFFIYSLFLFLATILALYFLPPLSYLADLSSFLLYFLFLLSLSFSLNFFNQFQSLFSHSTLPLHSHSTFCRLSYSTTVFSKCTSCYENVSYRSVSFEQNINNFIRSQIFLYLHQIIFCLQILASIFNLMILLTLRSDENGLKCVLPNNNPHKKLIFSILAFYYAPLASMGLNNSPTWDLSITFSIFLMYRPTCRIQNTNNKNFYQAQRISKRE